MKNIKDALGNTIEFGKTYGYSIDSNGITTITTGIAKKFTPKGYISLEVLTSMSALYNQEATESKYATAKIVSVKPLKLFKINRRF